MSLRNYSNTANTPALTADITALSTALALSTISGWPAAPCYGVLELGGTTPEVVLVQAIGAGTMTILRGQGGTTAAIHSAGARITHCDVALDFSEANTHGNATTGAHGVAGALVGTTDVQVLTNKTLTSPTLDTATARASASAPGVINKAASSGVQDIEQWATSAGVVLGKVTVAGGLQVPLVLVVNTATGTVPLTVKGVSGQTAKLISVQNNLAADQFTVDKLGKVNVTPSTDEATALVTIKLAGTSASGLELKNSLGTVIAKLDANGTAVVTGLYLNANGIFDKFTTSDNKVRIDPSSNVVLAGASLTLDHTVANNVPTAPNKLGKRLHWGTFTGTVDASGFLNVTHGAGFTPTTVVVTPNFPVGGTNIFSSASADGIGATIFRLRAFSPSGTLASVSVSGSYICGE